MRKKLGEVRRGQLLYNYGPGAILDFRTPEGAAISVLNGSLERWENEEFFTNKKILQSLKISESRLQKKLKVNYFVAPPVNPDEGQENEDKKYYGELVGIRFPKYLQCPSCNEIKENYYWEKGDFGEPARWCGKCSTNEKKIYVIPTRFILICSEGHVDEFPWDIMFYEIKHTKPNCRSIKKFAIQQQSTIGLSGMKLKCINCGNAESFENVYSKKFSHQLICSGKHLWKGPNVVEDCKATPRVTQRGASNAYFPCTVSVISIPPFSYQFENIMPPSFIGAVLKISNKEERKTFLKHLEASGQIFGNKTIDDINDIIENFNEAEKNADMINLKSDEYKTITESSRDFTMSSEYDFEAYPVEMNDYLKPYISKIIKVTKLREVRAIRGFTRVNPPTTPFQRGTSKIVELSTQQFGWLPAVENKGEGIFIEINREILNNIEKSKAYTTRVEQIANAFSSDFSARNKSQQLPLDINLSMLFAHSLSHALIREFSITCGYSTSSLKERIYSDEGNKKMCGILIFTSSSDSDGTLGGLSRIADEDRFTEIFINAIKNISWCSSDPICSENTSALKDDFILASCHSCMLIPETSCEYFNKYLDRKLLVDNENLNESVFNDLLKL